MRGIGSSLRTSSRHPPLPQRAEDPAVGVCLAGGWGVACGGAGAAHGAGVGGGAEDALEATDLSSELSGEVSVDLGFAEGELALDDLAGGRGGLTKPCYDLLGDALAILRAVEMGV